MTRLSGHERLGKYRDAIPAEGSEQSQPGSKQLNFVDQPPKLTLCRMGR